MNPKLAKRVINEIQEAAQEYGWSKKLSCSIIREVKEDLVLPILNLKANAKIHLAYLDDEEIILIVGRRDFQFDRKTGECVGTGTLLG